MLEIVLFYRDCKFNLTILRSTVTVPNKNMKFHVYMSGINITTLCGFTSVMWTLVHSMLAEGTTVEPPNRGHFGTAAFVLSSEVVLFSEVV